MCELFNSQLAELSRAAEDLCLAGLELEIIT